MNKDLNKESIEFLNFETALNKLEVMIEKMATGQLTLEESLQNFEEGIALARQCQQTLKEAEQKVQVLIEQNGEYQSQPFQPSMEE
jgi:exodeoxyribonuclease VII small subunit